MLGLFLAYDTSHGFMKMLEILSHFGSNAKIGQETIVLRKFQYSGHDYLKRWCGKAGLAGLLATALVLNGILTNGAILFCRRGFDSLTLDA